MLMLQFTGLPGAGKTTLACLVQQKLAACSIGCEIIDGDVYRQTLCKDLGFSAADRRENIRRLAAAAASFSSQGKVSIIAAINPFEDMRAELKLLYGAKIIWLNCSFDLLVKRDPKGLYRRALLPPGHFQKLNNLTGVNDPYDVPTSPDLVLDTGLNDIDTCCNQLLVYIKANLPASGFRIPVQAFV